MKEGYLIKMIQGSEREGSDTGGQEHVTLCTDIKDCQSTVRTSCLGGCTFITEYEAQNRHGICCSMTKQLPAWQVLM